jgi:hypothetical protein
MSMRLLLLPIFLFLSFNAGAMEIETKPAPEIEKPQEKTNLKQRRVKEYFKTKDIFTNGFYTNLHDSNSIVNVPKSKDVTRPNIYQFLMPGKEEFYRVKDNYALELVTLDDPINNQPLTVKITRTHIIVTARNIVLKNPEDFIIVLNPANMHTEKAGAAEYGGFGAEEDLGICTNLADSK